ncbi:hypothetical protein DIT71_03155 [Marinobacter vulgaris]|uniref:Uncharacterized protein n=1 Tax=Marinobacter vulgaris TaxID=1928331 RepID=A0A2V4A4A5_9GAMM|nr:hypothetical protein [Marinobacter vulgaris]PXX93810.1 hypothetical protein DIT71_03155 [Marinobacter vulgaris]TSJ72170.1 hypothetical protein FPC41_00115 [Marinobacter vulgaris]
MNNQDRYKKKFGINDEGIEKTQRALDYALDIRKFEIDMYWRRATYFWALIAVAFAGFFAVLGSKDIDQRELYSFIIGCVGLVFSWSWFLVNRGSKYWQENWENHVNMLEDSVIGPLYKTRLQRPKDDDIVEKIITGPAQLSVSKINQWVSFFTLIIWGFLIYSTLPPFLVSAPVSFLRIVIFGATILVCIMMCWKGKSHVFSYTHIMRSRKARIQ